MVKLRLTRNGRKGYASYRVVAIDSRKKRDGKALEYLGHYNPHTKTFEVNAERTKYWMGVGAQPSLTVLGLLVKSGILPKTKLSKKKFQAKPGAKSVARTEAKAEKANTKQAPAAEQPAAAEPAVETTADTEAAA